MAKLVVISGEARRREVVLKDGALIGRAEDCDVSVVGDHVSRHHARIRRSGTGYAIEDLNTVNGTLVNGKPVTTAELRDGDRIELGGCELAFVAGDEPAAPLVPTSRVINALDVGRTLPAVGGEGGSAAADTLRAHMRVLRGLSEAACGALEVDDLLQRILNELLRVYPQAEHAYVVAHGLGETAGDLRLFAARPGATSSDAVISQTLLETATSERRAMLAADVASDPRLSSAKSIVARNLRSLMCSPLVMGDRVLGAIQVDTTGLPPFTVDDLQLLVTVAGQAAIAVENVRLHRDILHQQRLAAVGQTISGLAHCVKNVLNGLKGGAYIVDVGLKKQNPETIAKGWDMVKHNTGFISELVLDMLAYCRKENLQLEPTEIGQLLEDTVRMIHSSASQKGVELSLTLQSEFPPIPLDPTAMKRVVLNLVTNAVEACPEGGRVQVIASLGEAGRELRVTVQDNGHGIPEEVRKNLFKPFFTTKGNRGTGLGLALVQKVVEEHKGRVEVDSEPGKGTAFHLLIPIP